VSLTRVANGKKFSIRKFLIILFGHLWVVELTYIYIFAFKFSLRSQQPDIFSIFQRHWRQICSCIVDTGGKFATGKNTSETGTTCVVDTGGKFATGVIDTGGNFAASVIDISGKFATGVVDNGGAP
jgi:hypothetical protein